MPGKSTIKFINSLKQKKFREKHQLFIVEGEKMVDEVMNSTFEMHSVYGTEQWIRERGLTPGIVDTDKRGTQPEHTENNENRNFYLYETKASELARMSNLKTANKVLALVRTPTFHLAQEALQNSFTLVLDKIQDPGNLGTLIRSADWFGVNTVILSGDSAEITNPKVVQSTMGSIFHVRFHYLDLPAFLISPETEGLPVLGAFTNAPDIYSANLPERGLLVLGNESRGISREVEKLITQKIGIPSRNRKGNQAESLNIAVAGSIIISEFIRRLG